MRVLITGGAGFIGSHIQDRCLELGYEVAILDNLFSGKKENISSDSKFYHLDIRASEVEAVFQEFCPEIMIHMAAQMDVRKSVADPRFDCEVNGLGTLNLLQNCVKAGTQKVIFASTGGALYGEQQEFPATEIHPTYPESPYGITKLLGEKYLYFYYKNYQLPYVCLRFSNVYGPRQNPHGEAGVVAIFCAKLLAGDPVTIFGDGSQTRDFVFVGDVVSAAQLAMQGTKVGEYNVSTGQETSVKGLWDALQRLLPEALKTHYAPARPGEQQRSVIAYQKIKRDLGWEPRVSLSDGLAKTLEYFKFLAT